MRPAPRATPEKSDVLAEAYIQAGRLLGLNQADLGAVIGKDRSTVSRGRIDPESKAGELALLLIRCYRALYVLTGGDTEQMTHWMHTRNLHTGGIPAEQVKSVQGLVTVLGYLDAIRGKI